MPMVPVAMTASRGRKSERQRNQDEHQGERNRAAMQRGLGEDRLHEPTIAAPSGLCSDSMSAANRGGGDPGGFADGAGVSPVVKMSAANRGGGDPGGFADGAGVSPVVKMSAANRGGQ